jgi:uncharacterized protein VirK/YbjX
MFKSRGWPALIAIREIVRYLRATDNPLLKREQREAPAIREFIFRPYVSNRWGLRRRLTEIANHYRLIQDRIPFLDLRNDEYYEVMQYDVPDNTLRIVMDRPPWMRREGQFGLSLFYGTDRIYTAMLHLSGTPDHLQLIVGNLQGDGRDRLAIYRTLTKVMHGMRPRDFLIHVVRIMAGELHCREVLGICDAGHRSAHSFSRAAKLATYDEIWREHGAVWNSESAFFSMPAGLHKRASEQIPAHKRGMYRRRYELLDELQQNLRERIARAAVQPPPRCIIGSTIASRNITATA